MTNCPSEATLRLIGTEAVGEATFAGSEGHVKQCPDCQKVLEAATKAVPHANHLAPAGNTPPTLPGLVIERELGRGGTSVVYLAREPVLNRHLAVKLFPRNSLVDPHARERWLGEARALSRVPHVHVVAIQRVDETDDWLWLVLEYVSGRTLKDRLTEPLPPDESVHTSAMMLEFNKQVNASIVDPDFIASVRKKLALDQREAAEIFGGGVSAFSRYENGKTKPSLALVKLLKLFDRHPDLLSEARSA
jgi:putative zinc finger/helix-turn-helix YgiT family protein